MTVELERVSIGGVWQYQAATEGGGGGSQTVYVQPDDPGAVGAGILWVDTFDDPPTAYIRNSADDAWLPWFPAEVGIPQGGPLDSDLDAAGNSITNVQAVTGDGSGDFDTGSGALLTQGGDVNTDGGDVKTGGGTVNTENGDLNIGSGEVVSDLTMGTGKNIVVGSAIDISVGGAVFSGTDQTGVAVTAEAIHAALVNLGIITA